VMEREKLRLVILGLTVAVVGAVAAWADWKTGWISAAFVLIAHQFYEIPRLAEIRRPSQLILVRWHLLVAWGLATVGLAASAWSSRHARFWMAIFWVGYVIRAIAWICGGNLPLVPGDSCHYLEVATSVFRGEGPVKHYVESFFTEYPQVLQGRGVLDDWATPLDAYVRALAFRLAGIDPGKSLEVTVGVAKACSFIINLLALPALYGFARRRFGAGAGLLAMAALAVLPVHAVYAGFVLRESLVALTSIMAVWTLSEIWNATGASWRAYGWALIAGLFGGLAILARNTGMALVAAAGIHAIYHLARRRPLPLLLWALVVIIVILPWALVTWREYGMPFYTYTNYFEYNFSWTVHHFDRGNTTPGQFYTWENAPEILRIKLKSLFIIVVYSTMILGLPLTVAFLRRLRLGSAKSPGRDADLLVATIGFVFVLATLKSVSDVTQVTQLGRYYLPVYAVTLPTAVLGLRDWLADLRIEGRAAGWVAAVTVALLWSDPTWAYDAGWFSKPYQLHWPALIEVGDWIRSHPDRVPPDARIMTWFPWELRIASDRTTILLPRNFKPERIKEVIDQYQVTHVLWGSFDQSPGTDPLLWEQDIDTLRSALGLSASNELFRSPRRTFFPVKLYRVR